MSRAPDQNVRPEFLGLGHPEERGDAPVSLKGGSPDRGGGGGPLLRHLLQLSMIADKAWNTNVDNNVSLRSDHSDLTLGR